MHVADVKIEGRIHSYAVGRIESRRRGRAAIAGVGLSAVAGYGIDGCTGDLADAMVVGVGDIDVVAAVDGDRGGITQCRSGGGRAVAGEARITGSRDRADVAAAYFTNAVVMRVGDVNVAVGVHGHAVGRVEHCAAGRRAIAAKALRAASSNCAHQAIHIHFEDAVVVRIGDEQVARRIEGHSSRHGKRDVGRLGRVCRSARRLRVRLRMAQPRQCRALRRVLRLRGIRPHAQKQRNYSHTHITQPAFHLYGLHRIHRFLRCRL